MGPGATAASCRRTASRGGSRWPSEDTGLAALPAAVLEQRIAALPEHAYYDWPTHQHMFHLPKEMRAEQPSAPIAADDPLYVEVAARAPRG